MIAHTLHIAAQILMMMPGTWPTNRDMHQNNMLAAIKMIAILDFFIIFAYNKSGWWGGILTRPHSGALLLFANCNNGGYCSYYRAN